MGVYIDHFSFESELDSGLLVEEYVDDVLGMCSHITWRLEWVYDDWPFRMLRIVNPHLSLAEQFATCEEVYTSNECDLPEAVLTCKALFSSAQ